MVNGKASGVLSFSSYQMCEHFLCGWGLLCVLVMGVVCYGAMCF